MRKKLFGLFAVCIFGPAFLSGCTSSHNSVQSYSIRSYQGPLPMNDYRYINPESYGVPAAAAH
jgi:hypothetical protein